MLILSVLKPNSYKKQLLFSCNTSHLLENSLGHPQDQNTESKVSNSVIACANMKRLHAYEQLLNLKIVLARAIQMRKFPT